MADKTPSVEDRITSLEAKVQEQNKTIQQQEKHIKALTTQLDKAANPEKAKKEEKPKLPEDEFSVDKRKYKFSIAEFQYKGKKMTALDALNDKEVLADLAAKGSGVITEIH